MKVYILDTDILSLFQRGHPAVCARADQHPATELATTVITVQEQLDGWHTRLARAKRRDELAGVYQRLADNVRFLARIQILSFTEPSIERYEQLKARKLNLGKMDLRIAAIVLEEGAVLVTRNTRDFQRVPGLVFEDWTV
jgi:tRNA(fMet)-specific endonuclease VapC